MFFLSIFFLILVPLIGVEVKGSKRWLDFILVPRFQPVELIKPFYIVIISMILSNNFNLNINYKYFVSLFIAIFIAALLMIQPDIGQTLLILSSWAILIFTYLRRLTFFLSITHGKFLQQWNPILPI